MQNRLFLLRDRALFQSLQDQGFGQNIGNDRCDAMIRSRQHRLHLGHQRSGTTGILQFQHGTFLLGQGQGLLVAQPATQCRQCGQVDWQALNAERHTLHQTLGLVLYQPQSQLRAGKLEHLDEIGMEGKQRRHHQVERIFPLGILQLAIHDRILARPGHPWRRATGQRRRAGQNLGEHRPPLGRRIQMIQQLGFRRIKQVGHARLAKPATA